MPCDTPHYVKVKGRLEDVPVPCGKCPVCKRNRVNQWVFRMQQEDMNSKRSHFVTLTYDTSSVPISPNGFMTLRKEDLQKFWKRLRKLQKEKIRYYAVGEYGTKSNRPHYHAIVFGVQKRSYFAEAWSIDGQQLGSVHVGNVSGASIAYTTKYIDKPSRIPMHRNDDREKELAFMSKGIGKNYINDATKRYHRANLDRNYVQGRNGIKIPMPKYYRDQILTDVLKEKQRTIIRSAVAYAAKMHKINFFRLYGDLMEYDRYIESEKYGRYNSFYSSFKNRDLL